MGVPPSHPCNRNRLLENIYSGVPPHGRLHCSPATGPGTSPGMAMGMAPGMAGMPLLGASSARVECCTLKRSCRKKMVFWCQNDSNLWVQQHKNKKQANNRVFSCFTNQLSLFYMGSSLNSCLKMPQQSVFHRDWQQGEAGATSHRWERQGARDFDH